MDELEVALDEGAELVARRLRRDLGAEHLVDLLHPGLEPRDQQVILALEVEIDRAVSDARFLRDLGDARGEEAVLREHRLGRSQDAFALVVAAVRC